MKNVELKDRIQSICAAWPELSCELETVETVDGSFIKISGGDQMLGKFEITVHNESSEMYESFAVRLNMKSCSILGLRKLIVANCAGKMLLAVGTMIQQFDN